MKIKDEKACRSSSLDQHLYEIHVIVYHYSDIDFKLEVEELSSHQKMFTTLLQH